MATPDLNPHNILHGRLTEEEKASLGLNYELASAFLEELLVSRRSHRSEGCTDWFCAAWKEIELLDDLPVHSLRQVLAICLERLA